MNIEKAQQCHIWKLNSSFFFDLHYGIITNEHQYVTKMAQSVRMGDLHEEISLSTNVNSLLE